MSACRRPDEATRQAPLAASPAIASSRTWIVTVLLAAVLALISALAPRAEAFVYWTNLDGDTIGRANLDGTGVEPSFITGATPTGINNVGVAVDAAHVYWTTREGIGRANLDSTDADLSFITSDPSRASAADGIAVDAAHIYWADSNAGTIGRAKLDGTGVDQDFIAGPSPVGVAVDAADVYWANRDTGTIGRANLDGSGVDQDFVTRTHPRQLLSIPTGVAVNATHIYWANFVDTIGRAKLDGTGVDRRFITREGNVNLSGVAVDDEHVYWGNQINRGVDNGTIGRAKLNGKGADNRFIAGVDSISGVAVDALRSFSFGKVKRNKKRGTAKLTVVVPGPGELDLAKTKKVKRAAKGADAEGSVKLPVKSRGKTKKKLNRKGTAKVEAEVTYTPQGGDPTIVGNTDTKTVKLIKR